MSSTTLYLITLREILLLNLGLMTLPRLSGQQTRGSSCLRIPPPHPFTWTGYKNLKEHLASFCRCFETTKNIVEEDSKILAQAMAKVHQIKNWNQTPNLLDSKGIIKRAKSTHLTCPIAAAAPSIDSRASVSKHSSWKRDHPRLFWTSLGSQHCQTQTEVPYPFTE